MIGLAGKKGAFLHRSGTRCEDWTVTSRMSRRELGISSVIMLKFAFCFFADYYYDKFTDGFLVGFVPQMTNLSRHIGIICL